MCPAGRRYWNVVSLALYDSSYSARRLMRVARFCCDPHTSNLWYREPILGPTWPKSTLRDKSGTTSKSSEISCSGNPLPLHYGGHSVSRVEMRSELCLYRYNAPPCGSKNIKTKSLRPFLTTQSNFFPHRHFDCKIATPKPFIT